MFGDAPRIHRLIASDDPEQDIVAVVYADRSAEGHVTALTYGLSCVDVNVELCLTMRSADAEWGMVPARMVDDSERDFVYESGFDEFWRLAFDPVRAAVVPTA